MRSASALAAILTSAAFLAMESRTWEGERTSFFGMGLQLWLSLSSAAASSPHHVFPKPPNQVPFYTHHAVCLFRVILYTTFSDRVNRDSSISSKKKRGGQLRLAPRCSLRHTPGRFRVG